jgi:8-amino-7-oxononanoate synthase
MLDFSSALYLGLRHASDELRPWTQLTMGAPAALVEPAAARVAAAGLAQLIGTEAGLLARSSLHALFDLIPRLAFDHQAAILVDGGVYPVGRWGVERAVGRGARALAVEHYVPPQMWRAAQAEASRGRRPLIVVDGVCPGCGRSAPLADYVDIARTFAGRLVIDDTQALGLLGPDGGGSLRALGSGAQRPAIIVASLAKAFGAPLAVVGGPRGEVEAYAQSSETRVHLSPPSLADVHAALRALEINAVEGDARRTHLSRLITRLRRGLTDLGLPVGAATPGVLAPVQRVPTGSLPPLTAQRWLLEHGVRGVVHRACDGQARLSLVLTASHRLADIDQALAAIAALTGPRPTPTIASPARWRNGVAAHA